MTVPLWRQVQKSNFRDSASLARFLELDEGFVFRNKPFPLNLPLRLAEKIQKRTLDDPILRQFVPVHEEAIVDPAFKMDPVGDLPAQKTKRLLHKYEGRALLISTGACAMHCRYCFRQHFDYEGDPLFIKELALLRADESITEVILSGGDPLSLGNEALSQLINRLEQIPHLTRIRFHTRFPLGIPERIDEGFLALLKETRLQVWFVIHCNHALELDADVLVALKRVQKLGIPVLNQSVLLKGVNDDFQVMKILLEKLVDNGIMPYYLHQLDPVQGAKHFMVDPQEGLVLMDRLVTQLPGFAVPKYVYECAGAPSKMSLTTFRA